MLVSSRNTLADTSRGNVEPTIWTSPCPVKLTSKINYHTGASHREQGLLQGTLLIFDDGNPTERLGEGILSLQKSMARTQDGIQVRTLQSQEGQGTQGNRQGYFSSRAWMMRVGGQESSADNSAAQLLNVIIQAIVYL